MIFFFFFCLIKIFTQNIINNYTIIHKKFYKVERY
jgi:hypothetical protein